MTALLSFSLLSTPFQRSFADGTETLGPASIPIASGSSVVAAGTGLLLAQPKPISITVPTGATIKQVLIYWEGESFVSAAPDDTIEVNGNTIAGALIGGPTIIFGRENPPASGIFENVYTATYRADITAGNFVVPGANSVSVGGLTFNVGNNGAGIMVIYDDGNGGTVTVLDGNDFAWDAFAPGPKSETVEQTFTFPPVTSATTAKLAMFFSSVEGTLSGLGKRPTRLQIKVNNATVANLFDVIDSFEGEEWDTLNLAINLLPGDSSVSIRAFSENFHSPTNAAASFIWSAAALSIANPPPPSTNCVPPKKDSDWKKDTNSWAAGGYTPGTTLGSVFDSAKLPPTIVGRTLLDALNSLSKVKKLDKSVKELLKQGVAALLNAADPLITYPQTAQQVIDEINMALMGTKKDREDLKKKYYEQNKKDCPKTGGGGGNCYTDGRPNLINFTLTGNNCASSANSQLVFSGKTSCFEFNGGLTGGSPVRVIATSSSTEPTASTARYFDADVALGAPLAVSSGSSTFGANTYFYLYEGGVLKMRIQIHTSCSAPLVNGETFGALRLDSYAIVP
jgi:hypothetical protein